MSVSCLLLDYTCTTPQTTGLILCQNIIYDLTFPLGIYIYIYIFMYHIQLLIQLRVFQTTMKTVLVINPIDCTREKQGSTLIMTSISDLIPTGNYWWFDSWPNQLIKQWRNCDLFKRITLYILYIWYVTITINFKLMSKSPDT